MRGAGCPQSDRDIGVANLPYRPLPIEMLKY